MELFTAVCKQFFTCFWFPWITFQKADKCLMGISEALTPPFLLHGISGYWESTSLSTSEILPHSSPSENANKLL